MRSKLELIPDAAHTFKELMEFLFQRTDRQIFRKEHLTRQKHAERQSLESMQSDDVEPEILPASAFITNDELSSYIGQRIDALNPFDRDHYSLRDLLSLALLRLTTETTPSRVLEASAGNDEDERVISEEVEEQHELQRTWQEWLIDYLKSYCRRYSERLQDADFLLNTGAQLLLQNHHTLVRVLLEFNDKTEVFSSQLLRETVRQIWSPFFTRSGVMSLLTSEEWTQPWAEKSMTQAFISMLVSAWSDPPPKAGSHSDPARIQRFMYAQKLIQHAERFLGEKFWVSVAVDHPLPVSTQTLAHTDNFDFEGEALPAEVIQHFEELASFKTPNEGRYEPCIRLINLRSAGRAQSDEAKNILEDLQKHEPELFQLVRTASKIACVVGDQRECPISHIELPDMVLMQLKRGDLILSPHISGALLFWMPELDEDHVVL